MPGKGATSEPVAISMFFVLITCMLPSSFVAVTWFLPVIFPNPDTCKTFSSQNTENSDSNYLSRLWTFNMNFTNREAANMYHHHPVQITK